MHLQVLNCLLMFPHQLSTLEMCVVFPQWTNLQSTYISCLFVILHSYSCRELNAVGLADPLSCTPPTENWFQDLINCRINSILQIDDGRIQLLSTMNDDFVQHKPVICMSLIINLHILQQELFPHQLLWLILKWKCLFLLPEFDKSFYYQCNTHYVHNLTGYLKCISSTEFLERIVFWTL